MEPEPQPAAPAVVAVVVTCDPGSWFEQALASLADQDYPNLSVLVIDAGQRGGSDPPGGRGDPGRLRHAPGAAGRLRPGRQRGPEAGRRGVPPALLPRRRGPGARRGARAWWRRPSGPTPASPPRSTSSGIDPDRLLAVGATADKVGVVQDLVEPGELDQEQHDGVREVFVAPGGATLVRADLFRALGGFNATIDQFGEDLDLSWRARVAGARVVVVPAARVRHLEAVRRGVRPGWGTPASQQRAGRLRRRAPGPHPAHLLPLVRPGSGSSRWRCSTCSARPSPGCCRDGPATPPTWWGRSPAPFAARPGCGGPGAGSSAGARRVTVTIRRLQTRGNARLRAFLRARVDDVRAGLPLRRRRRSRRRPAAPATDGGRGPDGLGRRRRRTSTPSERAGGPPGRTFGLATGRRWSGRSCSAVLIFGSRSLLGHPLAGHRPAAEPVDRVVRSLAVLVVHLADGGARGDGAEQPGPGPARACWPPSCSARSAPCSTWWCSDRLLIGPLGAYRAARWWGSRRGRLAALIAYAVVPLPYNALARGHWDGLVAYAAAPWVLAAIGRLSGEVPFPATRPERTGGRIVGLGLLVAVGGRGGPVAVSTSSRSSGVALLAGSALAGRVRPGLRMLGVAVGGHRGGGRPAAALVGCGPRQPGGHSGRGRRRDRPARLRPGAALRHRPGRPRARSAGPCWWPPPCPLFIGRGWRLAWASPAVGRRHRLLLAHLGRAAGLDPGPAARGRPGAGRRRPGRVGGPGRGRLRAGPARLPVRLAPAGRRRWLGWRWPWRRSRCSSRPVRVAGTCRAPTPARCWPSCPIRTAAATGSCGSARPTPCRWPAARSTRVSGTARRTTASPT